MPERTLLRIGSVSAIVGSVAFLVLLLLHPRSSGATTDADRLDQIATSGVGLPDHVGSLFALLLVVGGLVALYRSIAEEPAAAWARLGFASALMTGSLWVVLMGSDGIAMKEVADGWAVAPAADKEAVLLIRRSLDTLDDGILQAWNILFGMTFILYGLAMALSNEYPKWLAWIGVVGGVGSVLLALAQVYNVIDLRVPIFSLLLPVWVLVMGVLMWRKAGSAA